MFILIKSNTQKHSGILRINDLFYYLGILKGGVIMSNLEVEKKVSKIQGFDLSTLWKKEGWWNVWLGFILIIGSIFGILNSPVVPKRWGGDDGGILHSIPLELIPGIILTGIVTFIIFALSIYFVKKEEVKSFLLGFPVVYLITVVAYLIGNYGPWRHYGFNDVIWALVIGLIISNFFKVPEFLRSAIKTGLYIKTGLVLLGASILFNRVLTLGGMGLGVAWLVTPFVLIVMYFFSQKVLKMENERGLAIAISAATSVCGVSAAIASGTAAKAKKEEISLAISVTLIFTVIMMVVMPAVVSFVGIDPIVGGAWLGGTIDATGAVVAASSLLGDEAMEVASVIKMIQNVLIGIISFGIAVFWVSIYEKKELSEASVGPKEILTRVPKFIFGFVIASLVFSFALSPEVVESSLPAINGFRGLFFTLAFVSIGLESNFKDMAKMVKGGNIITLYLFGQILNIVLTLIAAYIFFSGRFFTLPF